MPLPILQAFLKPRRCGRLAAFSSRLHFLLWRSTTEKGPMMHRSSSYAAGCWWFIQRRSSSTVFTHAKKVAHTTGWRKSLSLLLFVIGLGLPLDAHGICFDINNPPHLGITYFPADGAVYGPTVNAACEHSGCWCANPLCGVGVSHWWETKQYDCAGNLWYIYSAASHCLTTPLDEDSYRDERAQYCKDQECYGPKCEDCNTTVGGPVQVLTGNLFTQPLV
jgi:hypothetical protein